MLLHTRVPIKYVCAHHAAPLREGWTAKKRKLSGSAAKVPRLLPAQVAAQDELMRLPPMTRTLPEARQQEGGL